MKTSAQNRTHMTAEIKASLNNTKRALCAFIVYSIYLAILYEARSFCWLDLGCVIGNIDVSCVLRFGSGLRKAYLAL